MCEGSHDKHQGRNESSPLPANSGQQQQGGSPPSTAAPASSDKDPTQRDNGTTTILSCSEPTSIVPMQTLICTALGANGSRRRVRVLIDSAATNTYVRTRVAKDLDLPQTGEVNEIHELFGGVETRSQTMKLVELKLANADGTHVVPVTARCTDVIAKNISSPPAGPWISEFAKRNVTFTDFGNDRLDVDVLIGNAHRPHLLTGDRALLGPSPGGLVAEKTVWGWVMSGEVKSPVIPNRTSTMTVTNLSMAAKVVPIRHPAEDVRGTHPVKLSTVGIPHRPCLAKAKKKDASSRPWGEIFGRPHRPRLSPNNWISR